MTISSQTFRFPYTSTGASVLYPYTNKILSENDLKVYVGDTLKALTTDYTVSGVGTAAGGNVTFLAAPAAGASVLITKDGVEFTQDTDYVENDSFPAASHEDALDKLTNIAQKIWDYTRRSIKMAITSTITDLEFPTPVANTYLGWNSTGTGIENKTLIALGSISDDAYNSTTWATVTTIAPSKHAMSDAIEAFVSDTTYNSTTWNGVLAVAPSKNAVRDEIETTRASTVSANATITDHSLVRGAGGMYVQSSTIIVDDSGQTTNTSQPAFLAVGGAQGNATGDGTAYTVTFGTEIFDQNADFDGASTFTAPVKGSYYLQTSVTCSDLAVAHTAGLLQIVTSNRNYNLFYGNIGALLAGGGFSANLSGSVLADMDAGDTATVVLTISNGTIIVDIDATTTKFSGFLVC
jgi:hypothetical protein